MARLELIQLKGLREVLLSDFLYLSNINSILSSIALAHTISSIRLAGDVSIFTIITY